MSTKSKSVLENIQAKEFLEESEFKPGATTSDMVYTKKSNDEISI